MRSTFCNSSVYTWQTGEQMLLHCNIPAGSHEHRFDSATSSILETHACKGSDPLHALSCLIRNEVLACVAYASSLCSLDLKSLFIAQNQLYYTLNNILMTLKLISAITEAAVQAYVARLSTHTLEVGHTSALSRLYVG